MQLNRLLDLPVARQAMVIGAIHRTRRQSLLDEALQQAAAHRRRDPEGVRRFATVAIDLAVTGGHQTAATEARLELGNALRILRRFQLSRSTLREAYTSITADGSSNLRSRFLGYMGSLALDEGRHEISLELLSEGVLCTRALESIPIWIRLSSAHMLAGDPVAARLACWRAMTLAEELDQPFLAASALTQLALVDCETGAAQAACELIERMQPILRVHANTNERLQVAWLEARALVGYGAVVEGLRRFRTLIGDRPSDPSVHSSTSVAIALDALEVTHGYRKSGEVEEILAILGEMAATGTFATALYGGLVRTARRGHNLTPVLERTRLATFGEGGVDHRGWLPADLRRR